MRDSASIKNVAFLHSSGAVSIKNVAFLNPLAVNMNEKKQTKPWQDRDTEIEDDLQEALKYVPIFFIIFVFLFHTRLYCASKRFHNF